jgi:hypothetical protein
MMSWSTFGSLSRRVGIVFLYLFLPWSLSCYVLFGALYFFSWRKEDHSGDTGTFVLMGAPLLPFIYGKILVDGRVKPWLAKNHT